MDVTARSLYGEDFYRWSKEQASALRRLGGRPDLANDLDWENLAEEIEYLGSERLHAVEGHLVQILAHLLKALALPASQSMDHWRAELAAFHDFLLRRYRPSMRQNIDIDREWRTAVKVAKALVASEGRRLDRLPEACPLGLDEILAEDFTFDRGLVLLAGALKAAPKG